MKLETIEFFYQKFQYNRNVLTPRFDTEVLIRKSIETIKNNNYDTLIDVWIWSWIIWISVEKNSSILEFYWLDLSSKALKIAQINKEKLSSKIKLIKSDLLKEFIDNQNKYNLKNKNVIITANLPYIKAWDWKNMSEDTILEPKMALFWWKKTWFELYKKLIKQTFKFREIYETKKITIIAEFGFDQEDIVRDFFEKQNINYSLFSDLRWINRFFIYEI